MTRTAPIAFTADTSAIDDALARLGDQFDGLEQRAAALGPSLAQMGETYRRQDLADDADYWQMTVARASDAQRELDQLDRAGQATRRQRAFDDARQQASLDALIASSASQAIVRMLQGRESFAQAAASLGDRLLQSELQNILRAVLTFGQGQAMQTASATAGAAERSSAEAAGAVQSTAITAATAGSNISAKAADAAAGAYAALSAVPLAGPALGAAAAAATFAAVLAYRGLFSAAGGWERVPFDGALASLHQDEMVLPAPYAAVMRGLAGTPSGGAAPAVTAHFHAAAGMPAMTDAQFRRFVSNNLTPLVSELANRHRNAVKA